MVLRVFRTVRTLRLDLQTKPARVGRRARHGDVGRLVERSCDGVHAMHAKRKKTAVLQQVLTASRTEDTMIRRAGTLRRDDSLAISHLYVFLGNTGDSVWSPKR